MKSILSKVKWGIIGPGKIAHRFADGLKETLSGELIAIASKTKDRRKSFGDNYNIDSSLRFETYEEIIQCSKVDAVLIGRQTALIDNPELTVRDVIGKNPIRVVVDTNRKLPLTLKIFTDNQSSSIVLCSEKKFDKNSQRLQGSSSE